MNYNDNYLRWLNEKKVDRATKKELKAISENETEKEFRFFKYLEFGTGGLRGIMMAGTNAMNVYTVAHATQGFANLIIEEGKQEKGIVIGRDSRNNSETFAKITASVMAANGIKTYFFDSLRPTPVLSFAVRYLGCVAGVNITASHNPKEYNGYKAYWEDGAQLSLEQADVVSSYIASTDIFDGVKTTDFDKAVEKGLIQIVGTEIDDAYIAEVTAQQIDRNAIPSVSDSLRIVYTPLHGCGYRLVPEVLRLCGVKHLYTVWQQMVLDGNFPTVVSPNPENSEALLLGSELAKKVGSDLVVASDPDADRVGIMVRNNKGEFVTMTGNQVGALLLDYILTAYENTKSMPSDPYAVKTIVTTEMATKICAEHGVEIFNVLTGFKFIGEVIKNHDDIGKGHYLFGFEESYGYLKGTYARDKDSVVTVMLISEMAAYYKAKNMTLFDAMNSLYERYGYYSEKTINVVMKGLDGLEKMKALMDGIRKNRPTELGGKKVVSFRDYQAETITNLITGEITPTGLPKSNVLYFETEGNNVVVIRPSGTEPKIKFYLLINGRTAKECSENTGSFLESLKKWTK
ncbi:MAG: phospho-sugar mutase [Clostridia bacterium]|nr:phospho-sugar mutase [Clostridia bacterium]